MSKQVTAMRVFRTLVLFLVVLKIWNDQSSKIVLYAFYMHIAMCVSEFMEMTCPDCFFDTSKRWGWQCCVRVIYIWAVGRLQYQLHKTVFRLIVIMFCDPSTVSLLVWLFGHNLISCFISFIWLTSNTCVHWQFRFSCFYRSLRCWSLIFKQILRLVSD